MTMLPGRAVELQKQGVALTDIAERLGVTVQQVVAWLRLMEYDPVDYHIDAIAQRVRDGTALYEALTECGIATHGPLAGRTRAMLRELGIVWHGSRAQFGTQKRIAERLPEGAMLCTECGIICSTDPSGLCINCRDESEYMDERAATLDFESHWWDRNFVKVGKHA